MLDVSIRVEEWDWDNDIQFTENEFMFKNYGKFSIKYKTTIIYKKTIEKNL